MNKSSASSKTSHHGSRTSALGANLPFSIDQILSASSAPMKQVAAVHQSMSAAGDTFDHQALQRQHQQHQQHLHLLSQQQQQQAAAMLMLNQASGGAHQTPAGAAPLGALLAPGSADIMSSAAVLNEQLALLVAAQQQQQQHNQRHLMKPNAIAAAAAQQHLHQQWQHQQLMAAAAAAFGQPGVNASSLGALGPALSSLASQPQQQNNTSPNHLLSCFMASMLLQQQQQQLEQHHLIDQHQRNAPMGGATSFMSQRALVDQQQQQQQEQQTNLAAHLNAVAAAAAAAHHRSPPSSMISSSSSNTTNSPVKQFFNGGGGSFDSPAPALHGLHPSAGSQQPRRESISPPPVRDSARASRAAQSTKSKSEGRAGAECSPASASQAPVKQSSGSSLSVKPLSELNSASGGSSTALSSLSNFVTNSLAPIFGEDLLGSTPKRGIPSLKSGGGGGPKRKSSGNNSNNNNSGYESQDEPGPRTPTDVKPTTAGILEAVNSALKARPRNATVAATVNAVMTKNPPELAQSQPAWVYCTRYSDRPSSGPRTRRAKSKDKKPKDTSKLSADEKRPRTAFTSEQLEKLRQEFQSNSYLDEKRRKSLADRLGLNENQIKIWFQNKRAKMKKQSQPNPLRGLLVAGGLYNHSTATSDCSESYANGAADDVGNRAMRDVEPDDDDEERDAASGKAPTANNNHGDRFDKRAATTARNNSGGNRSPGATSDHSSRSLLDGDHHGDNNKLVVTTITTSGDKSAAALVAAASQLKRRRTSQSDGDDENEELGENSSNPGPKRTKLNHMERNNNHDRAGDNEARAPASPGSPPVCSPARSPVLAVGEPVVTPVS